MELMFLDGSINRLFTKRLSVDEHGEIQLIGEGDWVNHVWHIDFITHGTYGYIYRMHHRESDEMWAIKVCPLIKHSIIDMLPEELKPENVEWRFLEALHSDLRGERWVIKLAGRLIGSDFPVLTKDSIMYVRPMLKKLIGNDYQKIHMKSAMFVMEWCAGGDLWDNLSREYELGKPAHDVEWWRNILFQFFYQLSVIDSKWEGWRHNDLSTHNVLLSHGKSEGEWGDEWVLPEIGTIVKICDFGFCYQRPHFENGRLMLPFIKLYGITDEKNRYFDIHYFVNSLLVALKPRAFPREVWLFLSEIVPSEYQGQRKGELVNEFRYRGDKELWIPKDIIKHHKFFSKYRK